MRCAEPKREGAEGNNNRNELNNNNKIICAFVIVTNCNYY